MSFRTKALDALTILGLLSAIVTASVVVKRELAGPPNPLPQGSTQTRPVKDWQQYIRTGRLIGPVNAPLTLVEFADFQCPACRGMNKVLQRLQSQYPGRLAIAYHYMPLPYHEMAYPTARAAECAAAQRRFAPYHDSLFANFDSLPRVSFVKLATQVGVPDIAAFTQCVNDTHAVPRIEADKALAVDTLRAGGTPTILVNGQLYMPAPTLAALKQMIESAGKPSARR